MTSKTVLEGLTVLNTRPSHLALETSQTIEAMGGRVSHIPSLVIQTLHINRNHLTAQVNRSDIILFCSRNAVVDSVISSIQQALQTKPQIKIGAIGLATAQALHDAGIIEVFFPRDHHSEGLLARPELRLVQDKHILLIKGQDGRQLLANELRSQGAKLDELIVYKRLLPNMSQQQCHRLWQQQPVDIVIGMSQESINNLFILFGKTGKPWLINTPWLLWSHRLDKVARHLGIKQFVVADNNDIFQTLVNWAQRKVPRNG